jgi:transposase
MRKSFDGLCGLVRDKLARDPMSGEVFIFINKARDKIKLLRWEPGGFTLYYKRLEEGRFTPARKQEGHARIAWSELVLMVEGVVPEKLRYQKRYRPRTDVDKKGL